MARTLWLEMKLELHSGFCGAHKLGSSKECVFLSEVQWKTDV